MENIEDIIKIAEFCGAKWYEVKFAGRNVKVLSFCFIRDNPDLGPMRWEYGDIIILNHNIPRYNEDLNAMQVAEDIARQKYGVVFETDYEELLRKVPIPIFNIGAGIKFKKFIEVIKSYENKTN